MKFLEILFHTFLACLRVVGPATYLQVHRFYFFSLHAACFYVYFSFHSSSISCHCPPCWPPLWSIHSLKRVLHCKLRITALKFHVSAVIPSFLQWVEWKGRESMGETTCVKNFCWIFPLWDKKCREESVLLSPALCVGILLHSQRVLDLGVGV